MRRYPSFNSPKETTLAAAVSQRSTESRFLSHGVKLLVLGIEGALFDRVVEHLPTGAVQADFAHADASFAFSCRPASELFVLTVDGNDVAGPACLNEILEIFERQVILRVAERAPLHVFVHAGVVSWRGHGIVFPGYSFSGKTTLVAELVRAGAEYYSDEYAIFDQAGRAEPYPRPLQMRKPDERQQTAVPIEELGGKIGLGPLTIDLIVFCTYRPRGLWRPRTISPGRGALELFRYTMSAQYAPDTALTTLQRVVTTAKIMKGTRGSSTEMVEFIGHTFSS
jgi:hypothetical protein